VEDTATARAANVDRRTVRTTWSDRDGTNIGIGMDGDIGEPAVLVLWAGTDRAYAPASTAMLSAVKEDEDEDEDEVDVAAEGAPPNGKSFGSNMAVSSFGMTRPMAAGIKAMGTAAREDDEVARFTTAGLGVGVGVGVGRVVPAGTRVRTGVAAGVVTAVAAAAVALGMVAEAAVEVEDTNDKGGKLGSLMLGLST
jgi:hypothetical protein